MSGKTKFESNDHVGSKFYAQDETLECQRGAEKRVSWRRLTRSCEDPKSNSSNSSLMSERSSSGDTGSNYTTRLVGEDTSARCQSVDSSLHPRHIERRRAPTLVTTLARTGTRRTRRRQRNRSHTPRTDRLGGSHRSMGTYLARGNK